MDSERNPYSLPLEKLCGAARPEQPSSVIHVTRVANCPSTSLK